MDPKRFQNELNQLMPNKHLRLVREPHRLGFDLWAVERRMDGRVWDLELRAMEESGLPRYHEGELEGYGKVRIDTCPPWRVVHVCVAESCKHSPPQFSVHDTQCYREPSMKDIASLRQWLNEWRDFAASLAGLKKETADAREKADAASTVDLAKAIKNSHLMRGANFFDAPATKFNKEKGSSLWLPVPQ